MVPDLRRCGPRLRTRDGTNPSHSDFHKHHADLRQGGGVYLLLRIQPMLAQSALASAIVVLIGVATAIHGAVVGRASADAKTSLASGKRNLRSLSRRRFSSKTATG